jgi:hypothetical protein
VGNNLSTDLEFTHEWVPLIQERLIDFIRVRVPKVGARSQVWQKFSAYGRHGRKAERATVNQAACVHGSSI